MINIAIKYKLKIEVYGLDSMPSFKFSYNNSEELITYFTQEMLYEGFLHHLVRRISILIKNIIDKYLNSCDKVLIRYQKLYIKKQVPLNQGERFNLKDLTKLMKPNYKNYLNYLIKKY